MPLLQMLLQAGADPYALDDEGVSMMGCVMEAGEQDDSAFEVQRLAGAYCPLPFPWLNTPLRTRWLCAGDRAAYGEEHARGGGWAGRAISAPPTHPQPAEAGDEATTGASGAAAATAAPGGEAAGSNAGACPDWRCRSVSGAVV